MNVARFRALLVVVAVLVGCAPAPRPNQPPAATTASSSQAAASAVTPNAVQTASTSDRAAFWRQLTQRLDRPPFALDYLHRGRGQIVATYDGDFGPYVACGSAMGVAQPVLAGAQRLQSRLIIHITGGSNGSGSVFTDAIHVVSLSSPASGAPEVVTVRADAPARTRSGGYCWSTGTMERLALPQ